MRPGRTLLATAAGAVLGAWVALALPLRGVPVGPGAPRTIPVVGPAPVTTLLAWTSGGLPPGYARAVAGLPSVERVAEVRSGMAWSTGWRARGGPTRRPSPGLSVPVEVAAIDPGTYRRFVSPADRAAIAGLADGGAVLGRTEAELRGIGVGGAIRLGDRVEPVEAVLEDALVGAHEVVVSAREGRRLGITEPRYLLVAPRGAGQRTETGLRRLTPAGVRLRVRAPGETPVFRHGDAVLSPVRLKELFGEFAATPRPDGTIRIDPAWVRENIREARVPILEGPIRCHRLVIPQIRAALAELVRRGLSDLIDPGDYGGCYSPRFANFDAGAGISHHAWGVAIDFNVSENPLGAEPGLDPRVVEVFRDAGFQWGGEFLVPDGMHFEFLEFPRSR